MIKTQLAPRIIAGWKASRWAYCSVCYRERRFGTDGLMLPHRMWYDGQMVSCLGSGTKPLPVRSP